MTVKTYALVITATGLIARRQEFEEGQQPVLAPAKGLRWIVDAPPNFNPATQTRTQTSPIPAEASEVPYVVAARPLVAVRAMRKAALAQLRWEKETGGITVAGAQIRTDRESQSLIAGAKLAIDSEALESVDWKAANGFVTLNGAQVTAIATAVAQHVQACFTNEKALSAALDAASTAVALLAVDLQAGWPT